MDKTYKDPADKGKEKRQEEDIEAQEEVLKMSSMTFDDFKSVPMQAARVPQPFEGYPEKKVVIGEYDDPERKLRDGKKNPNFGKTVDLIVNMTHVVGLNPTVPVFQDPSGLNTWIGDPKKGNEKIVDIQSSHNRVVSYLGRAINCVFDRPIEFEDGRQILCCIVPDPIYRCQLIYKYNGQTKRVEVDGRYLLPDMDQTSRLRQVYLMILNPKLRLEASIERNFYGTSDAESMSQTSMPGIGTGV